MVIFRKLETAGKRVKKFWKSYKYRFMPWLSLKIKHSYEASAGASHDESSKKSRHDLIHIHHLDHKDESLLRPDEVLHTLKTLCERLRDYPKEKCAPLEMSAIMSYNLEVLYEVFGFTTAREPSSLGPDVGTGVFVRRGRVKAGSIVALYPGTLYLPSDPLFFASIKNPYILRCEDGLLVDGNDRGLSKSIFKSCAARDRFGWEMPCCDLSWLTATPLNPLNIGQYVNNEDGDSHKHNLIYQEVLLPLPVSAAQGLPLQFWRFLPNVWYNTSSNAVGLRLVPLVAIRDIEEGEELFSSYFTIVHKS